MNIIEEQHKYLLNVYNRFPIDVDKGRGVYLFDKNGTCYLDFLAGIAVNALGYNHPVIIKALEKQIRRNLHLSNYFIQDIQVQLAARLIELTPFKKVFFTNSGTEAIEGMLKIVKKWGNNNNKNEIIAFEGSFHGRSLGALSITIQEKYQKSYLPLLPNIKTVPFNDAEAFKKTAGSKTAAVFYEGITGEGGVRPVSHEMYQAIEESRKKHDFLVIADEIQTGAGRTGSFYYFEQTQLIPDAIASAKGLGGGLPLGAFLVNDRLEDVFIKGEHGTTYGGNPLACATGLAAVNTISQQSFLDRVQRAGNYLKSSLSEIQQEFDNIVVDVRGQGLMIGMELQKDAKTVMNTAFKNGLLFNVADGSTLRFVPPLIISEQEIDEACQKLRLSFKKTFN